MKERKSWVMLGLAAALLFGLLGAFGIGLADVQRASRSDIEQRFQRSATNAGALTQALFSAAAGTAGQRDARRYGSPEVSSKKLGRVAAQGNNSYAVLLDENGGVVAASPHTPGLVLRRVQGKQHHIRAALSKQGFGLSSFLPAGGGQLATEYARGFDSPSGRRVLVTALDSSLMYQFLGGYIGEVKGVEGQRSYLLDGHDRVIASSEPGIDPGTLLRDPALVDALAAGGAGSYGSGQYFAASPVANSPWRLVNTAPESTLFSSVLGSQRWIPWMIFAAFAIASVAALVLLRRTLRAAGQLADANRRLAAANASLEQRALELKRSNKELELAQEQLQHDAMHDALTGLPNRVLFVDRLTQALIRADRHPDYRCAVLFLDVNRFKLINDSFSHTVGDELLKALARQLEVSLRPGDTIARMGGDEFTVLLDDVSTVRGALKAARRLQQSLEKPFTIAGRDLQVSASVGIAVSERGSDPAELIRNADIAMYNAKREGGSRNAIFDTGMHKRVLGQLRLETQLRQAIDGRSLEVAYQPIVELRVSGRQLEGNGLMADVKGALERAGLRGDVLRLEITESTIIDAPAQLHDLLRELREIGVGTQIDDFGTGYSSLTFLHHFQGDALKIDRSFIASMHREPGHAEIVRSIVGLAHSLGLRVIAEGVDDQGQLNLLRDLDCEYAQGYLFARPLHAEAIEELLASWEPATVSAA